MYCKRQLFRFSRRLALFVLAVTGAGCVHTSHSQYEQGKPQASCIGPSLLVAIGEEMELCDARLSYWQSWGIRRLY
jgi:hypothetical protein